MTPLKKTDFGQLRTAVDWSISQLEKPRANRIAALKQFVGAHYSEGGSDKNIPVNMLELAVTIYVRQLASRAPSVMISTGAEALKPFAADMEIALNQIPEEVGLAETMRKVVTEAIFGMGVIKVGISYSSSEDDAGEPFVELVTIDDYFLDMSAKSKSGVQFEGNDYWLPLETVKALFGDEVEGQKLVADEHTVTGDDGGARAEGVSSDEGADLYKEKVWLRDVYLHDSGQLITYGVKSGILYNVIDWDGPDTGPYHTLGFSDVPGNLLPLPPVALWLDLHEFGNNLFRKLARQADAKKSVVAFAGGQVEDANAFKKAADGDGIAYSGQKPEKIDIGGLDQAGLAMFLQTRDLFSYFAGNLDTLGGLSASSDTVGQDELLSDAANARVAHMKGQTLDLAKAIFGDLAWYEWTDPIRERIVNKPVKGGGFSLTKVWSADTRQGDFIDYNLDIDVYSMQDDSPATRLQKLGTALERFIFPMLPQLEAQGGQLDVRKLVESIADLSDTPELKDVIVFADGPGAGAQQPRGNPQPTATMPANTTRTYERVNRSGGTRSGNDSAMSRILMGGGVQPDEAAHLGTPT
jgi:hypothetical protein